MSKRNGLECAFLDGWTRGAHWNQQVSDGLIHDEDADGSHTRGGTPSVAQRAYIKWREESKEVIDRIEGLISSQAQRIIELETELKKLSN